MKVVKSEIGLFRPKSHCKVFNKLLPTYLLIHILIKIKYKR